jgi:HPt (histidine-containing phosphotransfer) domain-containing protein
MAAEMERVMNLSRAAESAASDATTAEEVLPDLDVADALERLGGDAEFLHEIAAIFRADMPARLAELASAVSAHDGPALVRAGHSLMGSAGNVSARRLYRLAQRLENGGKSGDFKDAKAALAQVPEAFERLDRALMAVC